MNADTLTVLTFLPKKGLVMRGFDPAELRRAGVDLGSLPDERGYLIDASSLPTTFAQNLERERVDTSRPIRVVGIIGRRSDGGPDRYAIYFRQD